MGGHALEHHGGGGLVVDGVRQMDRFPGRDVAGLGIGALEHGIGDAIADLFVGHTRADGFDDPGGFHADDFREVVERVKARAQIDVDEVETAGGLANADLAGGGIADLDVLVFEDFGSAGFVDADGLGHEKTPPWWWARASWRPGCCSGCGGILVMGGVGSKPVDGAGGC